MYVSLLQAFYEDVFEEMTQFGKIECLNVCDNYSDHLVGNVYIKFQDEQSALNAMTALQNRYYNGKQILAEFSPVADFREATCRQYEENQCKRGGYCNFMHLKPISRCENVLRPVTLGQRHHLTCITPPNAGGGNADVLVWNVRLASACERLRPRIVAVMVKL